MSVTGKDCLPAYQVEGLAFRDVLYSVLPSESQVIITSYEFQCCCNISAWKTYIKPENEGLYIITFQVWRPLQVNGCYKLVGANRFEIIGSGTVNESPDPSDVITAQPGDVVGYYNLFSELFQSTNFNSNFGIHLDRIHNASVWYHTRSNNDNNITGGPQCPLLMTSISSTNAGPIVTAIVSK